jgi:pimeloyl-ACP methyl ester carboxylesterase
MGAGSQATQWEPAFTDPIVAAGHRVVRFDWRDTGLSSWVARGARIPTALDLVGDVVAVLDRHGLDDAHLVGFSMGGGVAQLVAGLHPHRVRSLTALAAPAMGAQPPMDPDTVALMAEICGRQPEDHDELVACVLDRSRAVSRGSAIGFDEPTWRQRVEGWLARGHNRHCCHMRIWREHRASGGALADPEVGAAITRRIPVPTLAVHGAVDRLIPSANGRALASLVAGARSVVLPDRAHDLWLDPTGEVTSLVLDHLACADAHNTGSVRGSARD